MCFALLVVTCGTQSSLAAPVPVTTPATRGPVTDVLRLHQLLPQTVPLTPIPAVIDQRGRIQMETQYIVFEITRVEEIIQYPQGPVTVTKLVKVPITRVETRTVVLKDCKFYVVTKDGKLEAIDAEKATAILKKKTAVMTGNSADVDPRTLELLKPGTLCVIPLAPAAMPRAFEKIDD
jgi:hypothetical protein